MSNYSATVVRISNLRPHTNADRLICTNIFGNNVIVGKDTKEGDLGLYFPPESQLGEDYAKANDLLRRKDANGKAAGGMFDTNLRVRCQTFRGEKSMGFWIPIESLNNLFSNGKALDVFTEGQEIEEYLGKPIAKKYIPRNSQTNGSGKKKEGRKPRESKIIPDQFRFHFDTAQLGKNIHKISPNDLIAITWKVHGTSAIASNCLVKKKLGLLPGIAKFLGIEVIDSQYEYIYASRRVVKNEFFETKQHFYNYDLWSEVGKQYFGDKLHKGETVYYEICGFLKDGGFIQKGYDYGCEPGKERIYVYRITQTSVDGSVTELQWNQVKDRCKELGVDYTPEIFYGKANDVTLPEYTLDPQEHWHENYLEMLKRDYVFDQNSKFCSNPVPEEGICVRKEGLGIEVFKLKSFRFLEHETKMLDAEVIDIETNENN